MPHRHLGKPESPEKAVSKLRLVGDLELVEIAWRAFSVFQKEAPAEPLFPELGFCYVKTTLGVIQIDPGWMLLLIGGIIQRHKPQKGGEPVEVELTEDVIDATLDVLRSVPRHIERDLLGMYRQAEFLVRAKLVDNPHVPLDRPFTAEKTFEFFVGTKEKRRIFGNKILGDFLARPSLPDLLVPGVLEALVAAISEQDPAAANRWQKFLSKHFGQARRRGRRREKLYDILFERRAKDAKLSYGRLAIEVARAKNIEPSVAREHIKAAFSYRRRKQAAMRLRPASPGR